MTENDILRDIILEEERVPSTNEHVKLYTINPATAAKGINILVDKSILYKKRGIGMFVKAGAKTAIKQKRRSGRCCMRRTSMSAERTDWTEQGYNSMAHSRRRRLWMAFAAWLQNWCRITK